MIETIKSLSQMFNGSGSEYPLSEFLCQTIQKMGISCEIDSMGSVIAKVKGSERDRENIMITCPLDVPSFLLLYLEKKNGFLTKIGPDSFSPKIGDPVISESGKAYKLKKSLYDEKGFMVTGDSFRLGDSFRESIEISFYDQKFIGRYCARYCLMAMMLQILKGKPKNDLILAFAAGFETKAKSEANIAFRERPDLIFFLNSIESKEKNPFYFMKDGKRFSCESLIKKISMIAPDFQVFVSADPITKADTVFFPSTAKVLPLALPVKHLGKENETVAMESIEKLQKALTSLL